MAHLTARDIMRSKIFTADPNWTIDKLSRFLEEKSITGAPVVDTEGKPIGVVSVTDIAREHSIAKDSGHGREPHDFYSTSDNLPNWGEVVNTLRVEPEDKILVKDIMTPMVFDVTEETRVNKIAETMIRGRIHRVFVTKDKKLTGIITALDMLNLIKDVTENE